MRYYRYENEIDVRDVIVFSTSLVDLRLNGILDERLKSFFGYKSQLYSYNGDIQEYFKKFGINYREYYFPENEVYYILLKYRKTNNYWSKANRISRGLTIIFSEDKIEIFLPYIKFFNLNEKPGWREEDIYSLKWDNIEIYKKYDGTLIQVFYSKLLDKWFLSTQGLPMFSNLSKENISKIEFKNPYVKAFYEKYWDKIYPSLEKDKLYLFEYIKPGFAGSKIANNFHDKEEYRLLAVRDNILRIFESYEDLEKYDLNLKEKIDKPKIDRKLEGYVIEFYSEKRLEFKMVKIKTLYFRALMMGRFGLISAIIKGNIDDLYPYLSNTKKKYVEKVREILPEFRNLLETEYLPEFEEKVWKEFIKRFPEGDYRKFRDYVRGKSLDIIMPKIFYNYFKIHRDLDRLLTDILTATKKYDAKAFERLYRRLEKGL